MSKRRPLPDPDRRKFLKGATLAGAAAALTPPVAADAQVNAPADAPLAAMKAAAPGPIQIAVETQPPERDPVTQTTSGGDFMVDVFKTLDIDYLAMNCASSFRGLHEAVVNHAGNVKPEIFTCPHEEIAVSMGHGYAKIEGKPLAMICHGVVGLQHATMAMYNAWCDRVPVYRHGRHHHRSEQARPRRRMGALGDRHRRHHPRFHQVGRPADLAAAFRGIGGARLQDRDHPADGPGDALARCRAAGKSDQRRGEAAHPQVVEGGAAAGRFRRRRRSGQAAGEGRGAAHRGRPHGPHARRA